MLLEEKLQVQTAAERLKFISEYIKEHEKNYETSIIHYFCQFPYRKERDVFDEIQSICYMSNLSWVKMQVNDCFTRGKTNVFVLIEDRDYLEVANWVKEQGMKIEWITECSYRNFNYYKIYKEE